MQLQRSTDSLTLTFHRRGHPAGWIVVAVAGLLLLGVLGVLWWMSNHGPVYDDRFSGCADPVDCPLTDAEWDGERPVFRSAGAYLAAIPCELFPHDLERQERGEPIFEDDVQRILSRTAPCDRDLSLLPAQEIWALKGRSAWIGAREQEAWESVVRRLQDAELRRFRKATQTHGARLSMVGVATLGSLVLFGLSLGTRRRRERLQIRRNAVIVGRQELHTRYLRRVELEQERLTLYEVEHRVRLPPLQEPSLGPVSQVLQEHLPSRRSVDLDALLDDLRTAAPDLQEPYGTTLAWTHEGARLDLAPANLSRWRLARHGAAALLLGTGLLLGVHLFRLGPEITGAVDAAACASGEVQCSQARPAGALNSLQAYAARRVCQLVDAPIRDASYDDAASIGRQERARTSARFREVGRPDDLPGPCRDSSWQLGDTVPELWDLWQQGPRNRNVAWEQISELQREAEALIRAEWPLYRAQGSVDAWKAAILAARMRAELQAAALLVGLLAAMVLLHVARRRVRSVRVELEGQLLILDERRVPFSRIRTIAVEANRLRIELDDGEVLRTVPLEELAELEGFAKWVRARMQGRDELPAELQRLRRAVRGVRSE